MGHHPHCFYFRSRIPIEHESPPPLSLTGQNASSTLGISKKKTRSGFDENPEFMTNKVSLTRNGVKCASLTGGAVNDQGCQRQGDIFAFFYYRCLTGRMALAIPHASFFKRMFLYWHLSPANGPVTKNKPLSSTLIQIQMPLFAWHQQRR